MSLATRSSWRFRARARGVLQYIMSPSAGTELIRAGYRSTTGNSADGGTCRRRGVGQTTAAVDRRDRCGNAPSAIYRRSTRFPERGRLRNGEFSRGCFNPEFCTVRPVRRPDL